MTKPGPEPIDLPVTQEEFLLDVEQDRRALADMFDTPELSGMLSMMGVDPAEMKRMALDEAELARRTRESLGEDENGST